ncbi:MAG: phasin family protein [Gammaproteobacteria bacterium]|nr:phasin family protein [Gammaproteobacteria bacterium]
MANPIEDFTNQAGQTAFEAAKEIGQINTQVMERILQYQLTSMERLVEAGLKQAKRYSTAKSVEDLVSAQQAMVEESSQKGMESLRDSLDLVTETREAYTSLFQRGVADAMNQTKVKAPKKAA